MILVLTFLDSHNMYEQEHRLVSILVGTLHFKVADNYSGQHAWVRPLWSSFIRKKNQIDIDFSL